ncbi:uncharacterized protein LOC117011557 isoform X2 [Catharus ustulatus]|uniref:uncharacterized protein LOC117011557 isoform X2 n=1 Tax=Catharus ustulatus TaxID=91951 RepID=UPI001408DDD6|nr:uncharacterized protein LOC117011557 isoform X2 [Catharus ustulatus]
MDLGRAPSPRSPAGFGAGGQCCRSQGSCGLPGREGEARPSAAPPLPLLLFFLSPFILLCPSSPSRCFSSFSSHSSSSSRSSSAPGPAGANTQKQPRSALGGSEEVVPHVALGVTMGALGRTVRAPGAILRVPGRNWERFPSQYCSYWEHWEGTGRKQNLDGATAAGGRGQTQGRGYANPGAIARCHWWVGAARGYLGHVRAGGAGTMAAASVAHHPCSHPSKESCGYQVTEAPLLGPYKQRCTRSPWSSPGPAPPCERGLSEPGTLPFAALGASPSNDGAWADPPLLQAQPFSRWGDAKASGVSISLPCRGVPHMPWH